MGQRAPVHADVPAPPAQAGRPDLAGHPQSGTSKQEQSDLPSSWAASTVWGVGGPGDGVVSELHTASQAFAQIGNKVYVGGNFSYVQRDAAGTDRVDQAFVAAFDVNSGQLISSFQPELDGQVRALAALPDGRLAVGGDFAEVNGEPHLSLAFLDADTGAPTGWQVDAEDRSVGGVPFVRNFSIQDGQLYLSGSFTHLVQGTTEASGWNGGRISLSTGRPDTGWNPMLNGTSVGVDASDQGGRVYFSGYFKNTGETYTPSASAVSPSAGAGVAQAWDVKFSKPRANNSGNIWQLDVQEVGDRVYLGGSEHSLFGYDRASLSIRSGSITKAGGDFQVIETAGSNLYAGCHCGDFNYQDAYEWSDVGDSWTQADAIDTFGAWDAATGDYQPEWNPTVKGSHGWGAWGMMEDSTGTLWVGGDYASSVRAGGVNQWSGGFVRFNARDTQAPSTPGNVSSTNVDATSFRLQWSPSSDNSGNVSYEVLEDDRVIGTSGTASLVIDRQEGTHQYYVRGVDAQGNRSASTPAFEVTSADPEDYVDLVTLESDWTWRYESSAPPADWTAPTFDDSGWQEGSAILGFGSAGLGTDIGAGAPSPRPLSAQFRRSFMVDDASEIASAQLQVIANDGVIVYLNGEEIGRENLPNGPVTSSTYATAAPRSGAAQDNPYTFDIPGALLEDGVNVLTAQTHLNYRSTPDASFDLSMVGELGEQQTPPPPAAPVVSGEAASSTSATLSWDSVDGASGYRVVRDGEDVETLPGGATSFEDSGLSPETTYAYRVFALDDFGQETPSEEVEVTTPADTTMLERNGDWQWRYAASAPAGDWTSPGFDDSGWNAGASPLGFGSAGLGTDIGAGAPSPRPLSAQFRRSFSLADASQWASAEVSVPADDGVIVYVNGVEVGRSNLPSGSIGQNTYATAAPRTGSARGDREVFEVPGALLQDGENVVAAGTHLNYRSTPDASFDLAMVGELGEQQTPPPPAAPVVSGEAASSTSATLSWDSVDGASGYRVVRDGEDVETLPGGATSFEDSGLSPETTYAYRVFALDDFGQETPSEEVEVTTPADTTMLERNGDWQWRYAASAPAGDWTSPGFDDSGWNAGASPLGFGSAGLGTDIGAGAPSPRPLSAQFRRSFSLADASQWASAEVSVPADDGVIVYVNGVEVGRSNLPSGSIGQNTYATAAPRTGSARGDREVFEVPGALLQDGENVVAAGTHLNYRSTPDASFDLSMVGELGEQQTPPPPAAPVVSGEAASSTSATLSWDSVDGASGYRVVRDGEDVETLPGGATSFEDSGLSPETTYAYRVFALDDFGQETPSEEVEVTTPADTTMLERNGDWQWRYAASAPAGDWTSPGFDDSGWNAGASPLGFGSAGLGTDIGAGAPSPRPLSAQFRRSFSLADASQWASAEVSVPADDGVIVYVNGVEVGRSNLPSGSIGQNTYATAAPRTGSARGDREVFEVPGALLQDGENVVAAGTHLNYRSTPDASFDLSMVGELGEQQTPPPPAAPVVSGEAASSTSATLSWDSVDGASGYRVVRDGEDVETLPGGATSFEDSGLSPETTYAYRVFALDDFGQETPSEEVEVTTPADSTILAAGSDWSWRYAASAPDPDWITNGFDDSAWSSAAAVFGFGGTDVETDIGDGAPSPRPLAAQFRTEFTTGDLGGASTVTLNVLANDGVIVYINGEEVGRDNLPAGEIGQNTYATAAPRGLREVAFEVPVSVLNGGSNVIAAETHLNWRGTFDVRFDAEIVPSE